MNNIFLFAIFITFLSPLKLIAVTNPAQQQSLDPKLITELHIESLFFRNEEPPICDTTPEIALQFIPPSGWRFADASTLPGSVKTLVVGKGNYEFPPSLNLGMEVYAGSVKQYLKRVKEINANQGYDWKDLGKIRTKAGDASLSQVDTKTQWGEVKMMHVIFKQNDTIYILTAAALKQEFPRFYKDFFNAMCSLCFVEDKNT